MNANPRAKALRAVLAINDRVLTSLADYQISAFIDSGIATICLQITMRAKKKWATQQTWMIEDLACNAADDAFIEHTSELLIAEFDVAIKREES